MPSLADAMKAKYGSDGDSESPSEDAAEGGEDAEGAKLGGKLKSAMASGDGEMIYNAFRALAAHCEMKS